MVRIVICCSDMDASHIIFESMRAYLSAVGSDCELTIAANIETLENSIESGANNYDVIVLDEAQEKHLLFAKELRKINFVVSLVFIMADIKKHNLLRYRPTAVINDIRNHQQVATALKYSLEEQQYARPYFIIKTRESIVRIRFSDILYFESNKRIVVLYTKKKTIEFYGKLNDIMSYLPADSFVRCHQSYIVNLQYAKKLDRVNRCLMIDDRVIEISKSFYPKVVESFMR